MSDRVELLVNNQRIDRFERYEIDADLYVPADSFTLSFGNPRGLVLAEGDSCKLLVNGQTELVGVIDRIEERDSKDGSQTTVTGRDLMGLVVDQCLEEFVDITSTNLKTAAERLLAKVPLIDRKAVRFEPGKKSLTAATPLTRHLTPGQFVFDALREMALRRGAIFWCEPDGTFVIGAPLAKGAVTFSLVLARDGRSNVIDMGRVRDLSGRYQVITVLAHNDDAQNNASATVTDPSVPLRKVRVETIEGDEDSPALRARQLKEMQAAAGVAYSATVKGHSQNGHNWRPNLLSSIENTVRNYRATALVYGRTLKLSKTDGQTTEVRLGPPGVVQ